MGHNVLGQTVRNLCKKAGIDGNFTNHSLRATTVTRGLEKGVPEKLIMARTGHRDRRSLLTYQRPDVDILPNFCKFYEGHKFISTSYY